MRTNRLQLNSSKTEFLWCSSSRKQSQLDWTSFTIGTDAVVPAAAVRNLGLYRDNELSMKAHITSLVKAYFGILRQLKSISRSLRVTLPVN